MGIRLFLVLLYYCFSLVWLFKKSFSKNSDLNGKSETRLVSLAFRQLESASFSFAFSIYCVSNWNSNLQATKKLIKKPHNRNYWTMRRQEPQTDRMIESALSVSWSLSRWCSPLRSNRQHLKGYVSFSSFYPSQLWGSLVPRLSVDFVYVVQRLQSKI